LERRSRRKVRPPLTRLDGPFAPCSAGVRSLCPQIDQSYGLNSRAAREETTMEDQQVGWIAAIIIGGIAGWLAEQFMKSPMGLLMNIVLGIIGAAVASWLFGLLGVSFGGWIGYLIAGFVGACILIAIARALSGAFQRT
jgi:uncharacterized membrane protein YeaQ/YmgE (transglycosylase-associated protein family)